MNQPLQPQLLKLEDPWKKHVEQFLKQATAECVNGQLRTHLNLAIQDFKDLREHEMG